MPLASVFAAVAGFVLMFWRRLVGAFRLLVQKLSGKGATEARLVVVDATTGLVTSAAPTCDASSESRPSCSRRR
jgi:hypothetical protein